MLTYTLDELMGPDPLPHEVTRLGRRRARRQVRSRTCIVRMVADRMNRGLSLTAIRAEVLASIHEGCRGITCPCGFCGEVAASIMQQTLDLIIPPTEQEYPRP